MNDHPRLQPALSHRTPRSSQLRSTSGSPTRLRKTDDLLARLTPRAAVEALRNPTGELQVCMEHASPSEQAFAMRVAVASQSIYEWLEELSAWPWPTHDTSAGFERPPAKRRKLFERSASDNGLDDTEGQEQGNQYLGSVLATEVARYEQRIQEIGQEMEDLNVEEIKNHILHHHIMPLSRPGTPMSDSLRASTMSISAYAHMDDFTALVTATIVQALPNLSKLMQLLNTWSIRLLVLRKSSSFLTALVDAEIALKAGWKAMDPGRKSHGHTTKAPVINTSTLSRSEFDVMKPIVEQKVAKAGQYLDFMLDAMEGREDTLPEHWIDRMDAVEQDYAEWTASCERQIREAQWAKTAEATRSSREHSSAAVMEGTSGSSLLPVVPASTAPGEDVAVDVGGRPSSSGGDDTTKAEGHAEDLGSNGHRQNNRPDTDNDGLLSSLPAIIVHPAAGNGTRAGDSKQPASQGASKPTLDQAPVDRIDHVPQIDRLDDAGKSIVSDDSQAEPSGKSTSIAPTSVSGSDERTMATNLSSPAVKLPPPQAVDHTHEYSSDEDFPESEYPEPELPALPHGRRGSEVSNASTVVHGLQSGFAGFLSDSPDQGTPDYHRFRDVILPSTEGDCDNLVDGAGIPSSPPDFRSSTRSLSVSFNDIPTVVEAPENEDDEATPDTPVDMPLGAEDDPSQHDSPSKASVSSADDQLQQQISEILDSIPAKIRLASESPAINLNPPDFSMPTIRPKAKDSLPPRSYSSLSNRSSRAGTPSFTLAPAKNPRPRHQRGNQEIKLYHLSRSNGEPPIKLFIRCVGDHGERVMVRVGGGWADLGEYLKEYASHHGRRGGEAKVEVRDLPRISTASPPSRPASAMDMLSSSPVTPLNVRKARRSIGSSAADDLRLARQQPFPRTPLAHTAATAENNKTPSSGSSSRSRSSSRLSWTEEDSSLGMAGPKSKHIEMSEETKAWVESAKEKVRLASGDQRAAAAAALALAAKSPASSVPARAATPRAATPDPKLLADAGKFGELGKVGSTKRLFVRKNGTGTGLGNGNGFAAGK